VVTPTQAGEFEIVCNEFCGVGHHLMVGKVIVTPPGGAASTATDMPATTETASAKGAAQ
jgi:heme/copper-type cytochrome/quinol oxidase subunit 2